MELLTLSEPHTIRESLPIRYKAHSGERPFQEGSIPGTLDPGLSFNVPGIASNLVSTRSRGTSLSGDLSPGIFHLEEIKYPKIAPFQFESPFREESLSRVYSFFGRLLL